MRYVDGLWLGVCVPQLHDEGPLEEGVSRGGGENGSAVGASTRILWLLGMCPRPYCR